MVIYQATFLFDISSVISVQHFIPGQYVTGWWIYQLVRLSLKPNV